MSATVRRASERQRRHKAQACLLYLLSVCVSFQRVKKVFDFFARFKKRHIFCENRFSRKISLRSSKSLINQAFLMAINPISSGAFFSLQLGHAAALTCPRHVIHYRAAASLPLELPCCSIIFLLQHSFSTAWGEQCSPLRFCFGADQTVTHGRSMLAPTGAVHNLTPH